MRQLIRLLATVALFCSLGSVASETDAVQLGQTYTEHFYEGDISSIWDNMSAKMRDALGSKDGLREFREQVGLQLGSEIAVVDERVETNQIYRVYRRQCRFGKLDQPIVVSWTFDSNDRIVGFFVRPQQQPAKSPYLDYKTKSDLRLPFDDEWFVFWGGRTIESNYHAVVNDQRFAYDMLIVKGGKSHSGDGSTNEDYFCWGQPILAPATGTVIAVVANRPDNPPGTMDAEHPPGNYVMLDLGNAEFALLAHLQHGSTTVDESDEVNAGDEIGRCGNSGNTSEPHIHFHIQDQPAFGTGNGKPAFFKNYLSNGTRVAHGEPSRGERVRNAPFGND